MRTSHPATTPGAAPTRKDAVAQRFELWTAVGLLAILAVVCCSPLLTDGWYASHERVRPIARALAAYHEVAAGDLYPRWVSTAYHGRGAPLFNFYSPAFSLLAAWLHALGVPLLASLKLVVYALFLTGATGVYLWVRPHLGHHAAFVAAVLYLFAPYHFVDVYVRGATAEFASLAALPFLFRGIDLAVERLSARALATLAFASAGVVLSHFLAALMAAPLAVVYVAIRAVQAREGWRAVGRVAAGAALGAAVSAFYWLPALAEVGGLSAERMALNNTEYLSPYVHFVHPWQWLDGSWGFGASVPDPYTDEMSFQVGVLLVAAVALTLLLARLLAPEARRFVLLAAALVGVALWFTSSASRGWYALLKPYELVQFPWRFLGLATLFAAAAGGGFVRALSGRVPAAGPLAAAAAAAAALAISVPQRQVFEPITVADETAALDARVAADEWSAKFGNSDEYLPKGAEIDAANAPRGAASPWGIGAEVTAARGGGKDVTFEVTSPAGEGIVIVPWHAFPGWAATLDGRPWPLSPGPEGLLALWVPQGRHVARVRFGTTTPRVAGWLLAIGGLAALAALKRHERARRGGQPA